MSTRWWLLLALVGAGLANAHSGGVAYRATMPDGANDVQRLLPGEAGGYRVSVTSTADAAGTALVHAYLESREQSLPQYMFTSPEPRCAAPQFEMWQDSPRVFFAIGPLQPGETLACEYTVRRAADSIDDFGIHHEYPCSRCVTRRGTLPPSSFRIEAAGYDGRGALQRLVLVNGGSVGIARRVVATECAEFGGGYFGPRPFVLESDFPGGCPAADYGAGCLNFTGQNFDSVAFDLGPAPAGGEGSCLVRVVPTGGPGPDSIGMSFRDDVALLSNGALAFDVGANASVGLSGGGVPRATIPIPWSALAAIALAVLLTGVALLRRE